MAVEVRIIQVPNLKEGVDWLSFLITNSEGGSIQLGFAPTLVELEESCGMERDIFVDIWSKPLTDEDRARATRRKEYLRKNSERRRNG